MYTIKTNEKFIKTEYFLGKFFGFKVSATPKIYNNKVDADADLVQFNQYLNRYLSNASKRFDQEELDVIKNTLLVVEIKNKIEKLMDQPYKEVVKTIPKLQRQLKDAEYIAKGTNITSLKRDITRLKNIKKTKPAVVKMKLG